MTKGEESSVLDGCQRADSVSSEMEIGYPTEEEGMGTGIIWLQGSRGLTAVPLRNVLRTHGRGDFEIALDNENSYIIVEVIPAKIRRSVIDIGHEIPSRQ